VNRTSTTGASPARPRAWAAESSTSTEPTTRSPTTRAYTPELIVEHKAFADGTAALDYLAEHYPDAEQVVVLGKTAGSIAAPVYGGLAADLMPDDPALNADILGEQWGAYDAIPD
jgi:hypothetical protein